MRAMLLDRLYPDGLPAAPLHLVDWPLPEPGPGEVRVRVQACAVCHTELDEIEGRLPPPRLPLIPGHQVVGVVDALGSGVSRPACGTAVGVAWIHQACGHCRYCRAGDDNLCPQFQATGLDRHGGYAEYLTVPAGFAFPLPAGLDPVATAPLLCGGAIGYRALRQCRLQDGEPLGLMGFGASNHLVLLLARHLYPQSPVWVFARDPGERRFALDLGAAWSGDIAAAAPLPPVAVIDTTPAWQPVRAALRALTPGGRLVVNAIRKEDGDRACLAELDYAEELWREKSLQSVANVASRDVREFLQLAADARLRPTLTTWPLAAANDVLNRLRRGGLRGSQVLLPD